MNPIRKKEKKVEKISGCGFDCGACLAFKATMENNDELRRATSDGWFKVFGFRMPPEEIYCEGCFSQGKALDSGCLVRPCVRERGYSTCAECQEYPCDKLKTRLTTREEVIKGKDFDEETIRVFVEPYLNQERLEKIRKETCNK
jgi:hypothetical protein